MAAKKRVPYFDEDEVEETSLRFGGYTFKPVHFVILGPILGGLASGIYFTYDAYNRFLSIEQSVIEVLETTSRVQALEQTIGDNDVSRLGSQLTQINTQMATILEQQKSLLDLRSKVEKAELLTNGIDRRFLDLEADLDSTWNAIDALERPLN